jgi:hypothetical protein
MILEIFLAVGLITPGLSLIHLSGLKTENLIERLIISYILSLAIIFVILYLGAIFFVFIVTSYLATIVVVLSIFHQFVLWRKNSFKLDFLDSLLPNLQSKTLVVWISAISLFSVNVVFLLSRALLDSDVVQSYLPFARELVDMDGFTYTTGFDFNTHLKPIGVSVLYAWSYILSGSLLSEAFRLMPIVPIVLLVLLVYSITNEATKSKQHAIIASIIFMVLPFHDRLLFYNAFYPDVFYYPLVFFIIFAALRYSRERDPKLLVLSGAALGIGALLKAQTIYFSIAFLLYLAVMELRSRNIGFLLTLIAPMTILIPNLLAEAINANSTGSFQFQFSSDSFALILLACIISATAFVLLKPHSDSNNKQTNSFKNNKHDPSDESDNNETQQKSNGIGFWSFVVKAFYVIIPFVAISALWYLNNLLKFGSLLYTSSAGIPNMDWATDLMESIATDQSVHYSYYLSYFVFLLAHPAVMGYVWLVPLLIGAALVFRKENRGVRLLVFFSIITLTIIYAQVAYSISPEYLSVANPRDLLFLAPMLVTLVSMTLCYAGSLRTNPGCGGISMFITLLFVILFGIFSYVHSVFISYVGWLNPTPIFFEIPLGLLALFGLTPQQAGLQLWPLDRVQFLAKNFFPVLSLSLVIAIPLILLIGFELFLKLSKKHNLVPNRLILNFKRITSHIVNIIPSPSFAKDKTQAIKTVVIVGLVCSVIVVPRVVFITSQGGLSELQDFQLSNYYGSLYDLIVNDDPPLTGGVLTYMAPPGIHYYNPELNVIDLRYTANLAYLKDCFTNTTPQESTFKLKQLGINYLLLNPTNLEELDLALNGKFKSITENSMLSQLIASLGGWYVYELGPFELKETLIPLSDWSVDLRFTQGNYSIVNNDTGLVIELAAESPGDQVTIINTAFPKLNLTDFDYIAIDATGTSNAEVLFRLYLDNETSIDISYWDAPKQLNFSGFETHSSRSLRGDAYIGLRSSNNTPTSMILHELSIVELVPIANRTVLSLSDWSVDSRFTQGPYTALSNDTALFLELTSGASGDQLTVINTALPKLNVSDFDYIVIDATGTSNAEILFRLYLDDGSFIDAAYWDQPDQLGFFDLMAYSNRTFRGDAFIGLASSDGAPSSSVFLKISLIRIG